MTIGERRRERDQERRQHGTGLKKGRMEGK